MRLSAELIGSCEQRTNPLGERELVLRGLGIPALEHLGATRDQFDSLDFTDNRLGPRLENLPRLSRLQSLHLSHNLLEGIGSSSTTRRQQQQTKNASVQLLKKNVGSTLTTLILSYNSISSLAEVKNIGQAFPKLELLCLVGNPVTRRQHYRLYVIHHIPSLRCLDYIKINKTERDRAKRLSQSAAGAAMEADVEQEQQTQEQKSFIPGEGTSAQETFQTSFTPQQKEQIRSLLQNASSSQELQQIEDSVKKGIFPSHLIVTTPALVGEDGDGAENSGKRKRKDDTTTTTGDEEDESSSKRVKTTNGE